MTLDCTLYLVTDRPLCGGRSLAEVVRAAVAGGVTVVQLREKDLGAREYLETARKMKRLLDGLGVPLFLNDRLSVALASGAAGVHLGQNDLPCAHARRIAGDRLWIGVSASTPEEARRAEEDGADYVAVSPVYDTPTKTDAPEAAGLAGVRAIRAATSLPLVGIGGLSAKNTREAVRAGLDGVAVVSAICAAADPREAARAIRAEVEAGRVER